MQDVILQIREELRLNVDDRTRDSGQRYFKEDVHIYGVPTTTVTAIARRYLTTVKGQGKAEILALCERLWQSDYLEESFIACDWAYAFREEYCPGDFALLERWVSTYVSNWAACDTLCNHTIGAFIDRFPSHVDSLKSWATSDNRWMRRAAAVSLIIPARAGRFLDEVLAVADILLQDRDDLVQKGYGWMLKAASEAHRESVFQFVMQHKARMPRTALRYAVEKMPPELKARAMER